MTSDLVFRGGTVIDGTGTPGRTADVAISGGRITGVDRVDGAGRREIDVAGAVVCPGFIDLHSHADFTVFGSPDAVTQVTQGVTTLLTGNCGFSSFPITPEHRDDLLNHRLLPDGGDWEWSTAAEYAQRVAALPLGVNIALQTGHHAVRIAAMGLADRAPTPAELNRMRELLRQTAEDGVAGFSTGLIYAPGMYADTDEIAALAEVAAEDGLLYSTHMRNEGTRLVESVEEALAVARRSGVRLEISHLKASGKAAWGSVADALALIDAARADGVDVSADQYPYTASSTTLTAFLPGWAMDGGVPALVERLADAETSARIAAELDEITGWTYWPDRIVVASTGAGPYRPYEGRSVQDLAGDLGVSGGEATVELLRGQGGRVHIVHHSMSEDDVRYVMVRPDVAVASDGAVLNCPGEGKPHPRGLGTFVRVLGRYGRDEGVLGLPAAVRKMTSLPASRLGWTDRGVIAPGAVADIAVFDPDTVADNATFDDPWHLATGVSYTLLAGVPVLDDGEPTGVPAGAVLLRS